MLIVERADPDQFLFHQRDFLILGLFLRLQAGDLLVQLRDPLVQLRLLSDPPRGANLEQFGLARHHVLDIRIIGPIEQHRRKYDFVETLLFGLKPCCPRPQAVEILGDNGEAGLGDGVIEPHHHVAGLDDIAVARAHLTDNATGRMLHFLDARFDYDRARCNQGARDLGSGGPAAEPARQHAHHGQPDDQMQPDRWPRAPHFAAGHDLAAPASDTILMAGGGAVGGATRCSTCPSTVSLGPKACTRPSLRTSSISTASIPTGRCATTTTMAPRSRAARTARVSASSPSVSRLEFGSSRTIRNGSPYSALANATRCA